MIEIPAGEFAMGSNDANDQKPIHKVYLDAYYIDKYEVTVGQFRKFCSATGKSMPDQQTWNQGDNYPVVNVTWDDASAYATWAGKRLPTEAGRERAMGRVVVAR
jgi:formylglycine-generating enzyme required for sulfatase activity